MNNKIEHELHHRRFGRNIGVGLVLAGFVALVFGLTVVKVKFTDVRGGYEAANNPAGLETGGAGE